MRRAPREGHARVRPRRSSTGRRFLLTSGIAFGIWAVIAAVIISGAITIDDIDLFTRFGMGSSASE
jgi:hypothetical protein